MVFKFDRRISEEKFERDLVKSVEYDIKYQQNKLFKKEMSKLCDRINNISQYKDITVGVNAINTKDLICVPTNNESFYKHINEIHNLGKFDEVVNVVSKNHNHLSVFKVNELIDIFVESITRKVEENMHKYQKNEFENYFENHQLIQLHEKNEEMIVVGNKEFTRQIYDKHKLYSKNTFFQNEKEIMLNYLHSKLIINEHSHVASKVF
jgi:hypothetical protein